MAGRGRRLALLAISIAGALLVGAGCAAAWCEWCGVLGRRDAAKRNWQRAVPRLKQYLWLHPGDATATMLLARGLVTQDKCWDAVECLERIPDSGQRGPEARLQEAQVLLTCLKRGARAESALRRALAVKSDFHAAHLLLLDLFLMERRVEDARPIVLEACKSANAQTRFAALRNWFYIEFAEVPTDQIEPLLVQMLHNDPDDEGAAIALARISHGRARLEEARHALEKTGAQSLQARALLALCYIELGLAAQANALLDQWPDTLRDAQYWWLKGLDLQVNHSRWADAIACFRRVLELQPDRREVHHGIATCLLRIGKRDEAEEVRKEVERLQSILDFHSVAELIAAVATSPASADTRFRVAQFYEQLRRIDEARKWYEAVLDLDKNHAESRLALKKLVDLQ